MFQNGETEGGLKELSQIRSHWLFRPDHLIRAARHYERAAQILIQNSVKTVKKVCLLLSLIEKIIYNNCYISKKCLLF